MAKIFLSYSRVDRDRARNLERALTDAGLQVWRDEHSIDAGTNWSQEIEKGIRRSRGLVVLLSEASVESVWVAYETAFAAGARVPVVSVVVKGTRVPETLDRFEYVRFGVAGAAKKIDTGIRAQARAAGTEAASSPMLFARFQEADGEIVTASSGKVPSLCMELWIERAPPRTVRVSFELPDLSVPEAERRWTVKRPKRAGANVREFLTDDMNSYGDMEIWAAGSLPKGKPWSIRSTVYEALTRYYALNPQTGDIRRALRQIRKF